MVGFLKNLLNLSFKVKCGLRTCQKSLFVFKILLIRASNIFGGHIGESDFQLDASECEPDTGFEVRKDIVCGVAVRGFLCFSDVLHSQSDARREA